MISIERLIVVVGIAFVVLVTFPCGCQGATLRQLINENPNLSLFRTACSQLGLLELELDDTSQTFTIFAPTDTAIEDNNFMSLYTLGMDEDPPRWHEHLLRAIRNHMVPNFALTEEEVFQGAKTHLYSLEDPLRLEKSFRNIDGAQIQSADQVADNGMLHVVDRVLEPEFFKFSFSSLEKQKEFGPDWLDRTSMKTIVDFMDARSSYTHQIEEGQTHVGCRIRALNRIGLDYLPKTLNRSPEIVMGEFLNASFKDETVHNLIQYSLPHKNYYLRDIPRGHEEWIMSPNNCSHMLVTKSQSGKLCFNDACVVSVPDDRQYLANNGVGYVVDKCVVCSGVAMLLEYSAWLLDKPNLDDASQFFESSEWNLRNLSMSTGNGSKVTLFGARDEAYNIFNPQDVSRISTDKWKRHQWNFLEHNMLQGEYTMETFQSLWAENLGKPYNLTAISGENITFDYDEQRQVVLVQGGDVIASDLQGIDGYVCCFVFVSVFFRSCICFGLSFVCVCS